MHTPRIVVPKPAAERDHTCHALFNAFERFAKESTIKVTPPTTNNEGSFKRTRLPPLRPTLRLTEESVSVDIHNEEPVNEEHKASSPNYRLMSKDPRKLIEIIEKKEIEFKDMERVLVAAETTMEALRRENERLTQQLAARLTYTGNDVEFLIRNAVI